MLNEIFKKTFEMMKPFQDIIIFYLGWIVLHYMASHLYCMICTPLTFFGFILSPFQSSSPTPVPSRGSPPPSVRVARDARVIVSHGIAPIAVARARARARPSNESSLDKPPPALAWSRRRRVVVAAPSRLARTMTSGTPEEKARTPVSALRSERDDRESMVTRRKVTIRSTVLFYTWFASVIVRRRR